MHIKKIETFARPQVGLLRVTLEDGTTGWGQIASFEAADIVAEIVHRQIAPHVLGVSFDPVAGLLERIIDRTLKFHGSHISRATAALETAVVDALACVHGQSVSEWLGGHTRPVPVYGSSMLRSITPEQEAARLRRLRDESGFRAFKVRVGREAGHDVDEWPGRTEALIPAVRTALGHDITIHADGNSGFSPGRAIEVGRMLEANGYGHFEEPCPYWKLHWTREVAEALDIPVAGGEQDHAIAVWHEMIQGGIVDIVQPDICYCGGITTALDIARRAAAQGMPCVPHCANHSLILVFTMHLWNALERPGPFMEYSIEEQTMYAGMYENPPRLMEGQLHFNLDGPGWGLKISDEWLAASRYQSSEAGH